MGNLDDFLGECLIWVNILQYLQITSQIENLPLKSPKESLHGAEPFGVGGNTERNGCKLKSQSTWGFVENHCK